SKRLARLASPRQRRPPQPYKRCAALARRKGPPDSFGCGLSKLAQRNNLLSQRFEAWIAAQFIEHWINPNIANVSGGAFAVSSFHLVNCTLLVAEAEIHQRKLIRRDVAGLSALG